MAAMNVAVFGVGKTGSAQLPLTVANELICADLARGVRLPVPPSFLVYKGDEPYHVSLNFHLSGEDLPPANAGAIVADDPDLAWGLILFDAWICNRDRHAGNLAYDKATKRMTVFDHSHCFVASGATAGLDGLRGSLAIGGHCLASQAKAVDGVRRWHARIMEVPEFYVREAVQQTVGVGPMTTDVASFCADFLLERRPRLVDLLKASKATFPNVPAEQWAALEGG
jgi:hypothetical protein